MKYVSINGHEIPFTQPPEIVRRSLSFRLTKPGTWVEEAFLSIVWKHAGHLCTEVKVRGVYRDPVDNSIAHNYDLLFQIGKRLIESQQVNALVAAIEADALQHLDIELKGRGHAVGGQQ